MTSRRIFSMGSLGGATLLYCCSGSESKKENIAFSKSRLTHSETKFSGTKMNNPKARLEKFFRLIYKICDRLNYDTISKEL